MHRRTRPSEMSGSQLAALYCFIAAVFVLGLYCASLADAYKFYDKAVYIAP